MELLADFAQKAEHKREERKNNSIQQPRSRHIRFTHTFQSKFFEKMKIDMKRNQHIFGAW